MKDIISNEVELTINGKKETYVPKDSICFPKTPDGEFFEIGESYLVETVTKYWLGVCCGVSDTDVYLVNASFVASTGRYNEFMSGSDPSENEPLPEDKVIAISKGAITMKAKREIYLGGV